MREGVDRDTRVLEAEELYQHLNVWTEDVYSGGVDVLLERYAEVTDDTSALCYFLAHHSFLQGQLETALELLAQAYRGRKASGRIWRLFERIYLAMGDVKTAAFWAGMLAASPTRWTPILTTEAIKANRAMPDYVRGLSVASTLPVEFRPKDDGYTLHARIGDTLRSMEETTAPYWVGIYNRYRLHGQTAKELLQVPRDKISAYRGFYFDLCRCVEQGRDVELTAEPIDRLVPIAVADARAYDAIAVEITDGRDAGQIILGEMEWKYIRVRAGEQLRLGCEAAITVGKSVCLEHSPKRKKLVLNLMLDGLSWKVMKETAYRHIPNIYRFFQRGIIFDNAYCVAEYTYPSLATIETGQYPHHSQVLMHDVSVYAVESETLSVKAQKQGYYTVSTMCDMNGVGTGVLRGMDRIIGAVVDSQNAYMAVARTIEQMEALEETDQYIYVQIADAHSKSNSVSPLQPAAETHASWHESLMEEDDAVIRMTKRPLLVRDNLLDIEQMDRHLGMLFDYIETHYAEDEYVVHAYSDHGMSVHRKTDWFFDIGQANVAMMARGAGIPMHGHTDELVSLMDIHAIISRSIDAPLGDVDANLPAALGGRERDYIVSNSIFPGQTYKLDIRTKDYEYRLETTACTRRDGTVNLSEFTERVYDRATGEEIFDVAVLDAFLALAREHTKSFAHDTE